MLSPIAAITAMKMRFATSSQKDDAANGRVQRTTRNAARRTRGSGVSKIAMSSAYVCLKSPQRIPPPLDPLDLHLAEQPVRLHRQDRDERDERRDLLHPAAEDRVEVAAREVLEHPHHEPAHD